MVKVYLISEKTLKTNSVINNNVDGMYLLPAIEYAQEAGLQPLLGTALYDKLQDLVEDTSITGNTDYKILLDNYVTPYLVAKVTADIQIPLAFKVRNQGIVQQTGENTYVPSIKDTQYVAQYYDNQANFYGQRLSDYLCANRTKYPEYGTRNTYADMPSDRDAYNTGIYLG